MGTVTSLEDWRRGRDDDDPADRLERAVETLDDLLSGLPPQRLADAEIERELLAITGAVSVGLLDDAARRAERLTDRLTQRVRRGS
ncbi:MAG: hypothetical protein ABR600_08875 [Actinomycetota bacterium]